MGIQLWRSRWAAVGAAVAVTLGLGGVSLVSASPPDADPTVVTIEPCRLTDTRPGPNNKGPRSTPIGQNDTYDIQVTGSNGDCTIPAEALGIIATVTAVNQTASGFITVFPEGTTQPLSSNLNPVAGGPPTPNLVTVDLGSTGAISVFNKNGTVDLIIDIVAYTVDHDHDDDYLAKAGDTATGTLAASDFELTTPKAKVASIGEAGWVAHDSEPEVVSTFGNGGSYIAALNGGNDGLVARIQLPDGARLTTLVGHFNDTTNAGGENVTLTMHAYSPASGTYQSLATFSTFAGGGHQLRTAALDHTVDNDIRTYQFLVTGAVASDRRVRGVEVHYTIDEI